MRYSIERGDFEIEVHEITMVSPVYAEEGEEFQEYVYKDGKAVETGTLIGYEDEVELFLLDGIRFSNTPSK